MSKNLLRTKYAFIVALLGVSPAVLPLLGSEHHGTVKFGGLPLPGATVTAKQGDKSFNAITNLDGQYSFADLPHGAWTIQVEMPLFANLQQDLTVGPGAPATDWDLKLLPAQEISAIVTPAPPRLQVAETPAAASKNASRNGKAAPAPTNTQTAFQRTDLKAAPNATPAASSENENPAPADNTAPQDASALSQRAADGFLINGSVNNGASSPFAQLQAFGNNRRGVRSLYNGNLGFSLRNSALDARTFSLTGQDTPKPGYNQMQGLASFGGPVKIPFLVPRNGPNFNVNYQWTHNRNANTTSGLVPTQAQRDGELPGFVIPKSQISQQALALLNLYPLPNFSSTRYNYQIPLISGNHQDSVQARMNKQVRKNQYSGTFGLQSTRTDNTNLLGFLDNGRTLGMNLQLGFRHQFTPRAFVNLGFQFSRFSSENIPFFALRENISGLAGITGNNQEPVNYGPPALSFTSGITGLNDTQYSAIHNQNTGISVDALWNRGRHNITYGTSFRRLQLNSIGQQDPRGTFAFTPDINQTPGSDFAKFLLGTPDTASIATGNADKYFRSTSYDAFVTDDWRMRSSLTLNIGVRWEYNSPITELYGRLANMDVIPGFTAVTSVLGLSPTGTLTKQGYPASLVHPDKNNIAPRIGLSWRPFSASSMVVRAGYGVYYDTSIYQSIASRMAQQAPLSKSFQLNSKDAPLTLATGLIVPPSLINDPKITAPTFGVDPDFRVGYAQNWQVSVQRDLPAALQMVATYLGVKGTRSQQQFLPNTFPTGKCPGCVSGFTYLTSNGNSIRHAGTMQLRRRLRSGFTAELQYTFAKAIDNALLGGGGGALIAQDWLNLRGERALSNFDQRHLLSVTMQYTSGMGLRGGSLLGGWRGAALKEWTVSTQVTAGSGRPLTPIYPIVIPDTGITGIRPDYTGASLYDAPSGLFLNRAAYVAPAPGHWGNAGRNTITGPQQFSMNASMSRTFRINDRYSADLRIDATNALNHPVYPSWVTTISSAQFGLPTSANPMRSVQTTVRLRF